MWTKVSGPGTATFGDAAAVDTTVSFSAEGTYVLRLRADDGGLQATDDVTITIDEDADDDGLPDWWERECFGDTTSWGGSGDPDGDNLTNIDEYLLGTDPDNPDTDGDGLTDDVDADPIRPPRPLHGWGGGCGAAGAAAMLALLAVAWMRPSRWGIEGGRR